MVLISVPLRKAHPRVVLISVPLRKAHPRVVLISVPLRKAHPRVVLISVPLRKAHPRVVLISVGVQTIPPYAYASENAQVSGSQTVFGVKPGSFFGVRVGANGIRPTCTRPCNHSAPRGPSNGANAIRPYTGYLAKLRHRPHALEIRIKKESGHTLG